MVKNLLLQGYGEEMDLNCCEKMLYAANEAYQLGLNKEALKLAAGFGGGMAIENTCGALTGAIMVLGNLFVKKNAHESNRIKELTKELFASYEKAMGEINCKPLKAQYRTEELKCSLILLNAAEILDEIVQREKSEMERKEYSSKCKEKQSR